MEVKGYRKVIAGLSAVRIMEIVLGAIFILSSTGKMMDAARFGELISHYGFEWLSILSPAIIILELFVGTCLVLNLLPRVCSMLSILILTVFTIAFAYANLVNGIEDCGCFGRMGKSMPVTVTYIRNVVLLVLAVATWRLTRKWPLVAYQSCRKWKAGTITAVIIAGVFWTGHTWMPSSFYMNRFAKPHKLIGLDVNDSEIGQYLHVSSDSTYVVWVFSYTCASCINSIENIKQYQQGVADRFVPMAVNEDKNGRKRKLLNIDFTPLYVGEGLVDIIDVVPTLLYISEGKVKYVIEQMVPNVYLFKSIYLEKSNEEILTEY